MGNLASFVQTNFLGGEISQAAQGRMDLPAYKISLNVCTNAFPIDTGAWMRRPGTRHVAPTRGGAQGRGIPFAFAQSFPYVMQFTDGYLRFTTGPALVMTNDAQAVLAISAANPAVVQTAAAHGWSTGNSGVFNALGVNNPLLQNRQFLITVVDPTHFSIADAITGAAINGATLGAFVSGNFTRILELTTTYGSGSWSSLRSVQAETRTVLLNSAHPQVLQVESLPTTTQFAEFSLGAADFLDGPYLDPIEGSQMTPSAVNGVVTLTLSYAAYVATKAYNIGDFVSSGGASYESLTALNQGNAPAGSPANWAVVNGGTAVNDGRGFVTSDIGRLVRLFSEPALWDVAATYVAKDVVAYSDGAGGYLYYTATGAVAAGIQPGTSTLWAINATGGQWTWAQIVSVSGSGLIASVSPMGTLTGGGGLASAFDSNTSKGFAAAATFSASITTYPVWSATNWALGARCQYAGVGYQSIYAIIPSSAAATWSSSGLYAIGAQVQYFGVLYTAIQANGGGFGAAPVSDTSFWSVTAVINAAVPLGSSIWTSLGAMSSPTEDVYVGQHYTIASAIQSATLYPSSDVGFTNTPDALGLTINLRAKATAPASASDGTLLGTSGAMANSFSAVSITSNDHATTYNYVWFEVIATFTQPLPDTGSHVFTAKIGVSQAQFYAPNVNNGSVITAQIRGPALLYLQTIRTWRNGVYSDTTGWPTCGAYHEGRVWFGGVVSNRFDAGVSNGIDDVRLNFAPTDPGGAVNGNNAISYTCNGKEVNQILWMETDQQGVLFGTQEGPWLISAPSAGPMAPTNIKAVRVNGPGSANVEPRRSENTLLYVHRFARKVVESFADVFSGKFSAPNLSERAKHLTVGGIAEIAYQQELAPIIWARRTDGSLIGATYKRDRLTSSEGPNIIGWHKHQHGAGRTIESICVGPSQAGTLDTLSMITNDVASGVRHIELMTDLLDEGFALTDCWFLDDAIIPSSTTIDLTTSAAAPYGSLVVNGLHVHNGKTVTAFIAGLDCGDYVVSAGAITVPFGDSVSGGTGSGLFTQALVASFPTLPAVVGFTYNSDGQCVRPVTPADTGAQSGPGWAKLGRQHRVAAQLYGAVNGSISFGTDFTTMLPARLRYANDVPYPVNVQWSGIYRDAVNSLLDFDGMISWRISRPLPGFVMAVGGFDTKADA